MSRMVIDDEMWSRLEKLLPKPKGRHGKDDRLFMEAICWMLRTGAAWRDLPRMGQRLLFQAKGIV